MNIKAKQEDNRIIIDYARKGKYDYDKLERYCVTPPEILHRQNFPKKGYFHVVFLEMGVQSIK